MPAATAKIIKITAHQDYPWMHYQIVNPSPHPLLPGLGTAEVQALIKGQIQMAALSQQLQNQITLQQKKPSSKEVWMNRAVKNHKRRSCLYRVSGLERELLSQPRGEEHLSLPQGEARLSLEEVVLLCLPLIQMKQIQDIQTHLQQLKRRKKKKHYIER